MLPGIPRAARALPAVHVRAFRAVRKACAQARADARRFAALQTIPGARFIPPLGRAEREALRGVWTEPRGAERAANVLRSKGIPCKVWSLPAEPDLDLPAEYRITLDYGRRMRPADGDMSGWHGMSMRLPA